MRNSLAFLLIFNLGCSTLGKSKVYTSLASSAVCGVLGGYIGKESSPNKASEGFNKVIGLTTGATLCGIGGYFLGEMLYKSDPKNFEYPPIEIEEKKKQTPAQEFIENDFGHLNLSDLSIEKNDQAITPLIEGLPEELKKKIDKQRIIKYRIKPQAIKTKDGKVLYFSGGEAIEHVYESQQEESVKKQKD